MDSVKTAADQLGTDRIGRLMLRFAFPSVISMVVNALYNMVDQIFIGQGVGYLGNAATNIILPLTSLMMAFAFMIGDGSAARMSLNLGGGRPEKAAEAAGAAISASICAGIVLMIVLELAMVPVCRLFGATDSVLPYALDYGRIIVLGFPFAAIDGGLGGIIRADGRPKVTMAGLLIGCVTNIILDPLFILFFKWGVSGAAWATIIGQVLNAIFFVFQLFRFKSIKLRRAYLKPKAATLGKICATGLASFITQIANVVVCAVINNALVIYGAASKFGADIPLATFGISMKVNILVCGIVIGIAIGVQPIIGYNYGNGQYARVKQVFKWSNIVSFIVLCIAFLIFQFRPEIVIGLFGHESPLYMEFASKCFRIFLRMYPVIGFGILTSLLFQSIGKPIQSTVLSLARQIGFLVPSVIVCGKLLGIEGVLLAGPISDGLATALSAVVLIANWKRIFGKKIPSL